MSLAVSPVSPASPLIRRVSVVAPLTDPFKHIPLPTPRMRVADVMDELAKGIGKFYMPTSEGTVAHNRTPVELAFGCAAFPEFPAVSIEHPAGLYAFRGSSRHRRFFALLRVGEFQVVADLALRKAIVRVALNQQSFHFWEPKAKLPINRYEVRDQLRQCF